MVRFIFVSSSFYRASYKFSHFSFRAAGGKSGNRHTTDHCGARLYLLSNAQACFTRPELRQLELEDAFDGIVLSSDASVRKPDPRIMRRLLEENGLSVRESVMIGNDRLTDVAVARAVGMDCLYLETETSRKDLKGPRADYEVLSGSPAEHEIFRI